MATNATTTTATTTTNKQTNKQQQQQEEQEPPAARERAWCGGQDTVTDVEGGGGLELPEGHLLGGPLAIATVLGHVLQHGLPSVLLRDGRGPEISRCFFCCYLYFIFFPLVLNALHQYCTRHPLQ